MADPVVRYVRSFDGTSIAYSVLSETGPLPVFRFARPEWSHIPLLQQQEWPDSDSRTGEWRVIVSPRGTGQSDREPAARTAEAHGADILAVADALKYQRFVLMASEVGAIPALVLARSEPARVAGLVLIDPVITGERMWRGSYGRLMRALAEHDWDSWAEAYLFLHNGWNTLAQFAPGKPVAAFAKSIASLCRASLRAEDYLAWIDGSMPWDARPLLPAVHCPVLCLEVAAEARRIGGTDSEQVAREVASAELVTVRWGSEEHRVVPPFVESLARNLSSNRAERGSSAASSAFRTILFTDVVSSTPLLTQLRDQRMREVMRDHDAVMTAAVTGHGGRVVKTIGDAFMAEFAVPSAAVEAAIEAQRAIRDRFADSEVPVRIRIGINAGEPIEEDGDLHGASVVIAKRLESAADSGGILVSDVVKQMVTGKDFEFEDRGLVELKGFEEPVRAWAVRWE